MTRVFGVAAAVMVVMSGLGAARAADGDWEFQVTPYVWALGLDGDVGTRGVTAPVDLKFTEAVQDLDLAGMLALEAHNGSWGVLVDGIYMKLSDQSTGLIGTYGAEIEQKVLRAAGVYRLQGGEFTSVDVGLGVRGLQTEIMINRPSEAANVERSKSWVDPLVVARVRQNFTKSCFGVVGGDVGGFGVASDLTWQLTAIGGYSFTETLTGLLAYRYLDTDYDDDGFTYDIASHGLAVGLQISL